MYYLPCYYLILSPSKTHSVQLAVPHLLIRLRVCLVNVKQDDVLFIDIAVNFKQLRVTYERLLDLLLAR